MIWFVMLLLSALAVAFVLRPFLSKPANSAASNSSLAVYRDQLGEIDADHARGLIAAPEAEAARIEVKRRILQTDGASAEEKRVEISQVGVILAGGLFVALSVGIYLTLGAPSLPGHPYSATEETSAEQSQAAGEIDGMISKLEQHLKAKPDDVEGWRALGWAQMQIGRSHAGVEALKRAAALAPLKASIQAMYGEAMVREAEGDVGENALAVFDHVLSFAPKDPRARFYRGLYLSQNKQEKAALDLWIGIILDGPADAEWLPSIREQAKELSKKMGLDPLSVP